MDFGSIKIETEAAEFLSLKPKEIWEALRSICKKRYLHNLPENVTDFEPFKYPLTKLATLRDVCLSTGVVLDCKQYQIVDKTTDKEDESNDAVANFDNLPFKSQDIIDILPVVKHLDPGCDDAKVQIDLALRLMSEEKYEEALETLWGSIQILLSVIFIFCLKLIISNRFSVLFIRILLSAIPRSPTSTISSET